MKNIFTLTFLLFSLSSFGLSVDSLGDLPATIEVLLALESSHGDLPRYYEITEKSIKAKQKLEDCVDIDSNGVIEQFEIIFDSFQDYFGDEELPFEESLEEIKEKIDGLHFMKCSNKEKVNDELIEVTNFVSNGNSNKLDLKFELFRNTEFVEVP